MGFSLSASSHLARSSLGRLGADSRDCCTGVVHNRTGDYGSKALKQIGIRASTCGIFTAASRPLSKRRLNAENSFRISKPEMTRGRFRGPIPGSGGLVIAFAAPGYPER